VVSDAALDRGDVSHIPSLVWTRLRLGDAISAVSAAAPTSRFADVSRIVFVTKRSPEPPDSVPSEARAVQNRRVGCLRDDLHAKWN
jgi:hypothetical protein